MELLCRFDFGNDRVRPDPGYIKLERLFITSRYMWMNELRNRWHSTELPSPLRDIVYGKEGEFRIGLPAGSYRLYLRFYDPREDWAPFPVEAGAVDAYAPRFSGTVCQSALVSPEKGKELEVELSVAHRGGPLAVRFPRTEGGFFLSGLDVYGDRGVLPQPMYPEAPPDRLPAREALPEEAEPLAALEQVCRWLCDSRLPDGFIGDFEEGKRLWYTASYPIRTLLAGYRLLGKREYFDVSAYLLDLLVSEQLPEGGFTQAFRGKRTGLLSKAELEEVRRNNWMNLADVGSMVAALAAAARYADGERRQSYLRSVRRYLDDWAQRYHMPSGGYTNGWVLHPAEKIYSVSTASTALSLALFADLTGEERYLRRAEEAALFLAKDWNEDGRNWNAIFDGTYPGHDHYQGVNEFGDGFYTAEALSALLNLSDRRAVRAVLFGALRRYLFGEKGLLKLLNGGSWWPIQNNWHNSKSAGNPILLLDFLRFGPELGASGEELARVEEAYESCKRFLCTPECSRLLGVMLPDPQGVPFPAHSIQSWTGCTAAATGFAGIALAQMACPDILYRAKAGGSNG